LDYEEANRNAPLIGERSHHQSTAKLSHRCRRATGGKTYD
jgi:hypothetical protein